MRMEWVRNVIKQIIIIALALLFVMNSALCEQGTWDCPECGRTGNTGNYCGNCRHPAPWIENSQDNISKGSIGIGDIVCFGHYEQDNNLINGTEEIERLCWISVTTV